MARERSRTAWLYLLNATLLITHEIDSAYWEEWVLFHLPGGIEVFLVLNFVAVALVLYGFWRVVTRRSGAVAASYLVGERWSLRLWHSRLLPQ